MGEKIDIHNSEQDYKNNLDNLNKDKTFSLKNRQLITKFLSDCKAGKTVLHKEKKKIGYGSLNKYLFSLKLVARHLKVDFDSLDRDDRDCAIMNKFIDDFESNKIKKMTKVVGNKKVKGGVYAERTKRDVKVILKKFYKYTFCDNECFPKLVSWIDTCKNFEEKPALSREQVEAFVNKIKVLKHKAFVMLLFDSGARIQEFLNIRMEHLTFDKDKGAYKLRIQHSKTKPRTIFVPIATPSLREYLQGADDLDQDNPQTVLFDYTYNYCAKLLYKLGQKHLSMRLNAHLFRHSSASYYCKVLSRYQFCTRYGWSYSSNSPDIYIDREGMAETEIPQLIKQEHTDKLVKDNQQLREDMIHLTDRQEVFEKSILSEMKNQAIAKFNLQSISELPEPQKRNIGLMEVSVSQSGGSTMLDGKDKRFTPWSEEQNV